MNNNGFQVKEMNRGRILSNILPLFILKAKLMASSKIKQWI